MRLRPTVLLPFAVAVLAACATPQGAPTAVSASLQGDALRPAQAHWLRTELYCSIGDLDASEPERIEAETRWSRFLDSEVTPRFADGFSVIDAYGQWLARGASQPERLRSKIIVILHEDTPARAADIEAIRAAYKRLTGEQSVLRASQAVDVSF